MSRFRRLTQTIQFFQYHDLWVPEISLLDIKREGDVEVPNCVRAFSEQNECEILELNIQIGHVHGF